MQDFVEQEYKPFPVSVHDDMLDAFARLVDPDADIVWPDAESYVQATEPAYDFVD